eukprot:gnl/MRDRNA2_/MRDRNA2_18814_c0_seq1.p1 gnl/MRDRNA2_/MRDRNA2_18814_c0~~gnl/MRDRNA2_/MRDRNA2_18814_c0_seq1.p1  ORF type:complete len:527 (-),score=84.71 gnl/MRDRNA2_/MRDRNA2_18814_c0_seq1:12-1592(-)
MFDQNWLKRYMLANRPKGAKDDPGAPDAGRGVSAPRQPPPPRRVSIGESNEQVAYEKPKDAALDLEYPVSVVKNPDTIRPLESSSIERSSTQAVDLALPTQSNAAMPPTAFDAAPPWPVRGGQPPEFGNSAPAIYEEIIPEASQVDIGPPAEAFPGMHRPRPPLQSSQVGYSAPHSSRSGSGSAPRSTPHGVATTSTPSGGHGPLIAGTAPATSSGGMIPSPSPVIAPAMQSVIQSPVAATSYPVQYSQVSMPMQSPLQTSTFLAPPSGSVSYGGYSPGVSPFGYAAEGGFRNYVVMCRDDVEIRAAPSYADDVRTGQFLHPGQVVACDERRMVNGAWFLRLADQRGWAFETKERLLVMTQAHDFERGLWHYTIVCEDDVETRSSPTYSDEARTGICLGPGDCMAVDERCRVAGVLFLKLADGRGWIFESKDRLLVASQVRNKPAEARDFERGIWHYTIVCNDDVEVRAAPTYSDEARCGLMLRPGDCVAVDERCRQGGTWFLRLADGRGWLFETKDSQTVAVQMR